MLLEGIEDSEACLHVFLYLIISMYEFWHQLDDGVYKVLGNGHHPF